MLLLSRVYGSKMMLNDVIWKGIGTSVTPGVMYRLDWTYLPQRDWKTEGGGVEWTPFMFLALSN